MCRLQLFICAAGMCGAFAGSEEEYYAVLSNDRKEVAVYPSSATPQRPSGSRAGRPAGPQPAKRVSLFGSPALAIFGGPGWLVPPRWTSRIQGLHLLIFLGCSLLEPSLRGFS